RPTHEQSTRISHLLNRTCSLFLTHIITTTDLSFFAIYTLSLHDALPISLVQVRVNDLYNEAAASGSRFTFNNCHDVPLSYSALADRKSTRLHSSHVKISYAVFCLKKKSPQHQLSPLTRN